jgi:transposase InsO family protein
MGVPGAEAIRRTRPRGSSGIKCLMRTNGIQGAKRRGKPWRTTIADSAATRSPDLVNRDFAADRPDALWVADLTYLCVWEGRARSLTTVARTQSPTSL